MYVLVLTCLKRVVYPKPGFFHIFEGDVTLASGLWRPEVEFACCSAVASVGTE